jgi:hypothetical protein
LQSDEVGANSGTRVLRNPLLGRWTSERADEEWDAWTPARAAAEIGRTDVPWCVTGGWAIELFVGAAFRSHGDLEVAIPSSRWLELRSCLPDLEFFVAGSGELFSVESPALDEHHQTWGRDRLGRFRIDVFREPHDGSTWVCRRDSTIRRSYVDLIRRTQDGIPYMAPEVVLLFKAKHDLPKDREDLNEALPRMDEQSRTWLKNALAVVHPEHDWLGSVLASR